MSELQHYHHDWVEWIRREKLNLFCSHWQMINGVDDLYAAPTAYIERKKIQGIKPLLDGPHFHLPRIVFLQWKIPTLN
ncbi:hypothetical protein NF212_06610 [Parasalinivibrio latis]|uniref:hypothetical protein n=1 Tax=Parasalinivibrio latis TaxID=2952610 RepID=UPI0030E2E94C